MISPSERYFSPGSTGGQSSYYLKVFTEDNAGNISTPSPAFEFIPANFSVTKYYPLGTVTAMDKDGEFYTLISDQVSSTSLVVDAAGNKVAETRYYPFGEVRYSDGTLPTDRTYTGQRSEDFGLMDYNARYFSPVTGKFISADTLIPQPGNLLAWDRYGYAYNNPVIYNDPSGHDVDCGIGDSSIDGLGCRKRVEIEKNISYLDNERSRCAANPGGANCPNYLKIGAYTVTSLVLVGAVSSIAGVPSLGEIAGTSTTITSYACIDGDCANEANAVTQTIKRIWDLKPFARGIEAEKILRRSPALTQNFPVIDRWENGIATSIKSIDLTAKSYQNINVLTRTVQGYINTLAKWQGSYWGGVEIRAEQIAQRQLLLAIPPNALPTQIQVLEQLQRSALFQGVSLIWKAIH